MPSHISEARIVCPICGDMSCKSERYDVDKYEEPRDDFDVKCGNCKKMFRVERRVKIDYVMFII